MLKWTPPEARLVLVLDNETDPDHRYLGRAIAERLPGAEYRVYVDDPGSVPLDGVEGVVLSGSTASVYDEEAWMAPQRELVGACVEREVPLLGICFGHQLVNDALGGTVEFDRRRVGLVRMTDYETDGVLAGVEPVVPVVHGDVVVERGEGMEAVGEAGYDPNFCTRHESAPVWTVQFHPEFRRAFVDELPSWSQGPHEWAACNAVRTLDNFAALCR